MLEAVMFRTSNDEGWIMEVPFKKPVTQKRAVQRLVKFCKTYKFNIEWSSIYYHDTDKDIWFWSFVEMR